MMSVISEKNSSYTNQNLVRSFLNSKIPDAIRILDGALGWFSHKLLFSVVKCCYFLESTQPAIYFIQTVLNINRCFLSKRHLRYKFIP